MRHLKRTAKLGRTGEHRNAMLANLVCSLIKHRRVKTTFAKAKAARSVAEKLLTLAKRGTLHDRRLVSARLRQDEDAVRTLFQDIAPAHQARRGGYTRIVKLGCRQGDAALEAIIEWVDTVAPVVEATAAPTAEAKTTPSAEPAPETKAAPETPAATETKGESSPAPATK
ncbi:MAG: 50S ribosomal protein L17 [Verrucomicrobiota bacterium]|jgi:large subunit ribosomal protein L17